MRQITMALKVLRRQPQDNEPTTSNNSNTNREIVNCNTPLRPELGVHLIWKACVVLTVALKCKIERTFHLICKYSEYMVFQSIGRNSKYNFMVIPVVGLHHEDAHVKSCQPDNTGKPGCAVTS
jgi:hypothetical protein